MVTSHKQIRQMIQTETETIWEDKISEEVERRKHLVDTVEERGNISPQKIAQYREKDMERVERRTPWKGLQTKSNNLITPTRVQPSKFTSTISNCRDFCQGKYVFSLMYVGKLLQRQNCLNNIHINFGINDCKK